MPSNITNRVADGSTASSDGEGSLEAEATAPRWRLTPATDDITSADTTYALTEPSCDARRACVAGVSRTERIGYGDVSRRSIAVKPSTMKNSSLSLTRSRMPRYSANRWSETSSISITAEL